MRTLVIGDIHGAFRALKQILERVSPAPDDQLIFLGDYVDGWSESAEVIEFLIGLKLEYNCIFIRGNHDTWCEDWLRKAYSNPTWLIHGGKATVKSYGDFNAEKWERHLAFFDEMHNYYIDPENNLFIHAGFSSMHGPEHEIYSSNYSWDRTLWEMALAADKGMSKNSIAYPKRLTLFKEIFIGHTPTTNYGHEVPMNGMNVWNVDTGAAFHGKLTVMDIHTKEFWQSHVVKILYPGEKGRNRN